MGFMGALPQADLNEFPRKLEEPAESNNITVVIAKRDSSEVGEEGRVPKRKKPPVKAAILVDQMDFQFNEVAVGMRLPWNATPLFRQTALQSR